MITIVTVITQSHRDYVFANMELCHRLNPGVPIEWIVVDNGEDGHGPLELPKGLEQHVKILKGPGLHESTETGLNNFVRVGMPMAVAHKQLKKLRYSIHHSAGLEAGVSQCTSRFVCVMDPDFFVVRSDWVADLLHHLRTNDLAVIGVPWHVRWFKKTRGVPCVHFLLIDTEVLPLRPEWFRISYDRISRNYVSALWVRHLASSKDGGSTPGTNPSRAGPREWLALILEDIRQRGTLNFTADTGSPLEGVLAGMSSRVELIPTYFELDVDGMNGPVGPVQTSRWIEALLPDRFRYFPRHRYWSKWPKNAPGVERLRALGEVFHWHNRLFAFHLRLHGHGGVVPPGWRTAVEEAPTAL